MLTEELSARLNQNRLEVEPAPVLREPARSQLERTRQAALEQYLEHDADFAENFNHRVYAPSPVEKPEDLRQYHGTSIGAIFCPCEECQHLRNEAGSEMNGWVILPIVRLIRRVGRAPEVAEPEEARRPAVLIPY